MGKEIYEEIEGEFDEVLEKVKSYEPLSWEDRIIVKDNISEETDNTELIVKLVGGGAIYEHEFDLIYEIMEAKQR